MLPALVRNLLANPDTPNAVLYDAIEDTVGIANVAKIYVVSGRNGFVSTTYSWLVAAFLDKRAAGKLERKLNEWCRENKVHPDNVGPSAAQAFGSEGFSFRIASGSVLGGQMGILSDPDLRESLICPYDPAFRFDRWNGTCYEVKEVPLRGDPPELGE